MPFPISFMTANFVAQQADCRGGVSVEHEPFDEDPTDALRDDFRILDGWLRQLAA